VRRRGGSVVAVKYPARRPGVTDRRIPRPKFSASRGAGAPDSRPWRRGRHGVAGDSLGSKIGRSHLGRAGASPIFASSPQIVIGAAIGAAGGDALTDLCLSYKFGSY
jgi:hypothetical protein